RRSARAGDRRRARVLLLDRLLHLARHRHLDQPPALPGKADGHGARRAPAGGTRVARGLGGAGRARPSGRRRPVADLRACAWACRSHVLAERAGPVRSAACAVAEDRRRLLEAVALGRLQEARMLGLMMDAPLLVSSILEHAARVHGATEIVARTPEGGIHRTTYAEVHTRARQLAKALAALGVKPGDRV